MAKKLLIHLSDLHIGLSMDESNRTSQAFQEIARRYPGVPVIITGDLTDSAKLKEFTTAREFLNELAETNPILSVPGNHDYAWKGNILRVSGWEDWVEHLGTPLGWGGQDTDWMGVDHEVKGVDGLGVWKNGPIVYFGVDSGDPMDMQLSARGHISQELADALRKSLNAYKGKTRVVMLHHHPFSEGLFTKLRGSKLLLDAVRDRCELLLFGHGREYGIWWESNGVPLTISSHKTTDHLSGKCLFITVIEVDKPGTREVSFSHRLEII